MDMSAAPGWQADPFGRYPHRWWDGAGWSASVATAAGEIVSDPVHPPVHPQGISLDNNRLVTGSYSAPAIPATPIQPYAQTPNFSIPAGGPWAGPQQLVVANASKSPGMAIAAMILGIGSFFVALIPIFGLTSIPFAICGLVLGIAAVMRASKGFEGKGLGITGVVTSVAALLVSVIYLVAIGGAASDSPEINSDPSDGMCNPDRFLQDPDC